MSSRGLHLPGFEALEQRFRTECEIRPGLPDIEVHDEALYVPAARTREGAYLGALFDRDDARIGAADLLRGHRLMNHGGPQPEGKRVAGTGLYLGWLFPAYGHALLESLARAWGPKDGDFAVYHAPINSRIPRFLQDHLDRLGVPPVRVPDVPTRFDRLIVPWPAFEIRMRAYRGFAELFPGRRGTDPQPVWVSRSRLPPPQRAIAGEDIVEDHLADWRILHVQELSVAEQMDAFSSHTTYTGMTGSAMHNVLFNRSPRVIHLTAGEPNLNFLLCDELVGAESLYAGCCDAGGLPDLGRQTPLRVDLARAAEALEVPIDVGLQPAVDERHREMWAEVRLRQGLRRRDRSTLTELRRHYSGPLTPRLARLARDLPVYAPRRGRRSARAWAADLVAGARR